MNTWLETIPDSQLAAERLAADLAWRGIQQRPYEPGAVLPIQPFKAHLSHWWLIDGEQPPKVESCGKTTCLVCGAKREFELT